MEHLFESPGMTDLTIIVIVIEVLSLLLLWAILAMFWMTVRKQHALLSTLKGVSSKLPRHFFLVLAYILTTLIIGIVTTVMFVFEPRLF